MKKLILLALLLSSCNSNSNSSDAPNTTGSTSAFPDCTDISTGDNTFLDPQFVGYLDVGDRHFVCSRGNYDEDFFWFVSQEAILLNFNVTTTDNTDSVLAVWTMVASTNSMGEEEIEYTLIYEFFSDHGVLEGNDWPVPNTNHGFVIGITPFGPAEYQSELWSY